MTLDRNSFLKLTKKAKKRLLQMHYENEVGHIGGNLSVIDILIFVFHNVLKEDEYCILSKGHSAGALYITLWTRGILLEEQLDTFHQDATKLVGHPISNWLNEIPFSTGSLGHGASLACGTSYANKIKNKKNRTYCILSDGELNEGSIWEAFMFATTHKLNISFIIDYNKLQALGDINQIINQDNLKQRLSTFIHNIIEIDGHSFNDLNNHLTKTTDGPLIILANTIKGNAVSYMENDYSWHYWPMNEKQYQTALDDIDKYYEKRII